MRLTGTLKTWNDDRGFGFIAPAGGGADVFLHISELPRDGTRPTEGERLTYAMGRGKNGRPQAVNVIRQAFGDTRRRAPVAPARSSRAANGFPKVISLVLLLALAAYGYRHYEQKVSSYSAPAAITPVDAAPEPPLQAVPPAPPLAPMPQEPTTPSPAQVSSPQAFRCDGRTHCSQMTSCSEAQFFLNNCPNTAMDGNHDGTPCEKQWCTSMFVK